MLRSEKKQGLLDGVREKRFSNPWLLGALLLTVVGLLTSMGYFFLLVPQQVFGTLPCSSSVLQRATHARSAGSSYVAASSQPRVTPMRYA